MITTQIHFDERRQKFDKYLDVVKPFTKFTVNTFAGICFVKSNYNIVWPELLASAGLFDHETFRQFVSLI